jgi:hypothetical protein
VIRITSRRAVNGEAQEIGLVNVIARMITKAGTAVVRTGKKQTGGTIRAVKAVGITARMNELGVTRVVITRVEVIVQIMKVGLRLRTLTARTERAAAREGARAK